MCGSTKTGCVQSLHFRVSKSACSDLDIAGNFVGPSFRSMLLREEVKLTKRQYSLHSLTKLRNLVIVVGGIMPFMASTVLKATPRLPGLIL